MTASMLGLADLEVEMMKFIIKITKSTSRTAENHSMLAVNNQDFSDFSYDFEEHGGAL